MRRRKRARPLLGARGVGVGTGRSAWDWGIWVVGDGKCGISSRSGGGEVRDELRFNKGRRGLLRHWKRIWLRG